MKSTPGQLALAIFIPTLAVALLLVTLPAPPAAARRIALARTITATVAPIAPLHGWTVAQGDGAIFTLNADGSLLQLDPTNLTVQARSQPLFEVVTNSHPVHLAAGESQIFVSNPAVSKTLVLERSNLTPVATIENAGPLGLHTGQRLFLAPQNNFSALELQGHFLAYNLTNLAQPPQKISIGCFMPQAFEVDPAQQSLYVTALEVCASPPHRRQQIFQYHLDTLTPTNKSQLRQGYGYLSNLSRGGQYLVAAYSHYANSTDLILFNPNLKEANRLPLSYYTQSAQVAVDPSGPWIYLLLERMLWVLPASTLTPHSILTFNAPITQGTISLSPAGNILYLFDGRQLRAYSTQALQNVGLSFSGPLPLSWQPTYGQFLTYPAPGTDTTAFVQLRTFYGGSPELYRTTDGGKSWTFLPALLNTSPEGEEDFGRILSLSPTFAGDQTLAMMTYRGTVLRSTNAGQSWGAWTPRLAFVSEQNGNRELYTMNYNGTAVRRLTHSPAAKENPAWSPAWTHLAFQSNPTGNWDIYTLRADCRITQTDAACAPRQLTNHPSDDLLPAWSPDGRAIAFVSTRDGNPELYLMDSNGQNQRRLTFNSSGDWRPAWLPDSRHLLFTSGRNGSNDIFMLNVPTALTAPLTAEPVITPVVTGPADDRDPAVSSNAEIFFLSDRDGTLKTYRLDLTLPAARPRLYTDTGLPEAHPTLFGPGFGQRRLFVAARRNGTSQIFEVTYSPETGSYSIYTPLTNADSFSGQPAAGPVWWEPTPEFSLAWLQAAAQN